MADDTATAPPEDETKPAEGAEGAAAEEGKAENDGKLKQTVEITDVGPCKKHVKITVERDAIDERFEEKFDELLKDGTAAVPGFRPGKAPRKYIVRKFRSSVTEDVRREVLMASLQQLAEDSNISPLAPPELAPEDLVLPEEGPFIYEFDVEVRPEFDLPDYKGLKLKRPVRTFSDADVEKEEKRILARYGRVIPKEGGAVELGDYIITD